MSEQPATIGWQVVDPNGNVVQSGEVTRAQMTVEVAEAFGLGEKE